jgi:ribonuclease G
MVQVVKDPIGTKGARGFRRRSASRAGCRFTCPRTASAFRRIEDEEERAHLREKLQQLLPPSVTGGFIIRTMAETASDS